MAYSKAQLDKIGNLLVYITEKVGVVSKMKLLKLVYIIEEEYIKQAGVPLTELSFMHWPQGPVSTFVNTQIDKNREALKPYIIAEKTPNATWIKPAKAFQDDEFSDFDLELIDDVLTRFGRFTAKELSDYTHREGSLWKLINDEYAGKPPAQTNIDLTQLLAGDDIEPELRQAAQERDAFLDYLTSKA